MTVSLLTHSDVRNICTALHIAPTKTLGQNFVHDGGTVRKIVAAAGIEPGEHVLEVGPGLGSLTLGLLAARARVTAVEIDPLLATALPATVRGHGGVDLRVLHADAISVRSVADLERARPIHEDGGDAGNLAYVADGAESGDGTDPAGPAGESQPDSVWGPPTKLVANLPYNVAVPLVLNVLENFPTISELLVMVQTEVAQRLCAPPGGRIYGVPSVKVAWYGNATMAGSISRNVFWPTPHVDSSLVRIRRHENGGPVGAQGVPRREVFKLVDLAFAQRRKTLRACLKNWAGGADTAEELLTAAGIAPQRRGETLTVEDFINLTRCAVERGLTSGGATQLSGDLPSAAGAEAAAGVEPAKAAPTAGDIAP